MSKKIRGGKPFKCLLTVSPVPLTATASGKHVLASTIYSKSTLRSVAGQLFENQTHIDYFPSYEIVTNPRMHSTAFADNLRSVRDETVDNVMRHFFAQHLIIEANSENKYSPQARKTLKKIYNVKKQFWRHLGNGYISNWQFSYWGIQKATWLIWG